MIGILNATTRLTRKVANSAGEHVMHLLRRSSVAVLVDAENISVKHFPQVVETMRQKGRIREIRIYGPISLLNTAAWSVAVTSYGAKRVPCTGCKPGKNSTDIRMAVDAMDLMASKRYVTFVLVSDDTDFAPLARRLREGGKHVIGVGRSNRNGQYRKAFDEFLMIADKETGVNETMKPVSAPSRMIDKASRKCGIDTHVLSLAVKCVRLGAEDGSWCPMSTFGTLMHTEQPSFSAKRYGCKNLTAFVVKTGLFELKGTQPHTYIRVRAA